MKEIKNILFFIKYIKPQWKTLLVCLEVYLLISREKLHHALEYEKKLVNYVMMVAVA